LPEHHLDGLRLDAVHSINDRSSEHIVATVTKQARQRWRPQRHHRRGKRAAAGVLLRGPEAGGYGVDAVWNDDFHHSAVVAITGRREVSP
jgi:maltooligosyltrehalose trehalohydrolase